MQSEEIKMRNEYAFVGDVASKLLSQINEPRNIDDLLKTSLGDSLSLIRGLKNGELTLIGARPSMGKTALALRILRDFSLFKDKTVVYFSPDIIKEELVWRLMKSSAGIKDNAFGTRKVSDDEYRRLSGFIDSLTYPNPIIDDTSGISVDEIYDKSIRLNNKESIDLVIVDELQDLQASKEFNSSREEMEYNVKRLKELAQVLDIPIMITSNVTEAVDNRQDHHPKIEDLRAIGDIEQFLDTIMFIYRENYYIDGGYQYNGLAEITIPKQHDGCSDSFYLVWKPEYYAFYEHKYDEKIYLGLNVYDCEISKLYDD